MASRRQEEGKEGMDGKHLPGLCTGSGRIGPAGGLRGFGQESGVKASDSGRSGTHGRGGLREKAKLLYITRRPVGENEKSET